MNNNDIETTQKKKSFIAVWLLCIIAIFALVAFSLYYAYKDSNHNTTYDNTLDFDMPYTEKPQEPIIYFETYPTDNINTHDKKIDTQPPNNTTSHLSTKQQTKLPQHNKNKRFKKPKVVIIIDDLANPKDIKRFQSLHLKLTLSLFPKQFFSKHNPAIAKTLDFYMIHLPLEAHHFEQKGVIVLRTGDSLQTIESHIAQIKHDFPQLHYINNHTGSRYTESIEDMQRLLHVLDKHGITFVDSRTTAKSAMKAIASKRKKPYLARNVFLDNEANIPAISKQLDLALKIADTRGYVIAIGHPKEPTYQTLKQYKQRLLHDYEVVYINELDALLQQYNLKDTDTPLPF